MGFSFSKASLDKLKGVHHDLVKICQRAIQLSEVDFRITCGVRTKAEQEALYAQGRTKPGKIVTQTLKSRHIGGFAVDVVALPHGVVSWNPIFYKQIAEAFKAAESELSIPIEWGGDWKFKDYPHFELDRHIYPDKA